MPVDAIEGRACTQEASLLGVVAWRSDFRLTCSASCVGNKTRSFCFGCWIPRQASCQTSLLTTQVQTDQTLLRRLLNARTNSRTWISPKSVKEAPRDPNAKTKVSPSLSPPSPCLSPSSLPPSLPSTTHSSSYKPMSKASLRSRGRSKDNSPRAL